MAAPLNLGATMAQLIGGVNSKPVQATIYRCPPQAEHHFGFRLAAVCVVRGAGWLRSATLPTNAFTIPWWSYGSSLGGSSSLAARLAPVARSRRISTSRGASWTNPRSFHMISAAVRLPFMRPLLEWLLVRST